MPLLSTHSHPTTTYWKEAGAATHQLILCARTLIGWELRYRRSRGHRVSRMRAHCAKLSTTVNSLREHILDHIPDKHQHDAISHILDEGSHSISAYCQAISNGKAADTPADTPTDPVTLYRRFLIQVGDANIINASPRVFPSTSYAILGKLLILRLTSSALHLSTLVPSAPTAKKDLRFAITSPTTITTAPPSPAERLTIPPALAHSSLLDIDFAFRARISPDPTVSPPIFPVVRIESLQSALLHIRKTRRRTILTSLHLFVLRIRHSLVYSVKAKQRQVLDFIGDSTKHASLVEYLVLLQSIERAEKHLAEKTVKRTGKHLAEKVVKRV